MPRTHGYSNRGERCYGTCNWGAKGRINVIGALIGKVLFAVGLFTSNIDTAVFTAWVKHFLLPSLSTRTVIVMDNATFHKNCQETLLLLHPVDSITAPLHTKKYTPKLMFYQ